MKLNLTSTLAAALVVMTTAISMAMAVPTSEPGAVGVAEVVKRDRLYDLANDLDGATEVDEFHNWSDLWGGRLMSLFKRDLLSELTKGLVEEVNAAVGEATVDDFHKWAAVWGERLKSVKRTDQLLHHHIVGPHEDDTASTAVVQPSVSVSVSVSVLTVATCTTDNYSASTPSAQPEVPIPGTAPTGAPEHPSSTVGSSSESPTSEAAHTNATVVFPTLASASVTPASSSDTNASVGSSASVLHTSTLTLFIAKSSSIASSSITPTATSVPTPVPSTSSANHLTIFDYAALFVWNLWVVHLAIGS